MITAQTLAQRQAYPLDLKIGLSENRIRHWYAAHAGNVYVAFSGGKDSTVLLDIVRRLYPEVPAVYVDTGLEYPEIKAFVRTIDNVTWLRPKMTFRKVIEKHGYPMISKVVARAVARIRSPGSSQRSKHKAMYGDERGSYGKLPVKWRPLLAAPFAMSDRCCEIMKIRPILTYHKTEQRAGYVGTMAADSNSRQKQYLTHGCYLDHLRVPRCTPIAFWTDSDIWAYLKERAVPYCSIYDTGVRHTGCMFCGFGLHLEAEPNRFQLMAETHPDLHRYCMDKLGLRDVLAWLGIPSEPGEAATCGPCRRGDPHAFGEDGPASGGLGPGLFDDHLAGDAAVEPVRAAGPADHGI
ncbi:MAG: phosphoadenosine phosphosulfate reductase family protein [Candidatus Neomarinimicrobiota bacterium]